MKAVSHVQSHRTHKEQSWEANPFSSMCVQSLQLCLILCHPMDCSSPGFSIHGILQAGILDWVAMPPPGDLHNTGIKPMSPGFSAL